MTKKEKQRLKILELKAENKALKEELSKKDDIIQYIEDLRPHWASGHSSDGVAAQCSYAALTTLWQMINVKNQTEAVIRILQLISTEKDKT